MASWQIEHLFGTPLIPTRLPPTLDLSYMMQPNTAVRDGAVPTGAASLVQHLLGFVDRMTARPDGQAAAMSWAIRHDVVDLKPTQEVPVTPRWEAFWSALCAIEGAVNVTIADPRLPATMMEAPELRLRQSRDEIYTPEVGMTLAPRQALLLPGWLRVTCSAGSAPATMVRVSFVAPPEGARA